ncbi:MAG: helix-turn-helix domain-containing protein [Alphaproteobacteria bacterium]|nr:helix-turn-helix domain-containing protein [Alphaproteobacteria bacterium]
MTDIKLAKFARVPPGAAMDKSLSKAALKVLIALCGHANPKNLAWPSQSTIAIKSGISRQRVNAALQELCDRQWIVLVKKRKNRRQWSPNLYEINFDRPLDDILPNQQCHHMDDTVSVPPSPTLIRHPTSDNNNLTIRKKSNQRAGHSTSNGLSPFQNLLKGLAKRGFSSEDIFEIALNVDSDAVSQLFTDQRSGGPLHKGSDDLLTLLKSLSNK